MEDEYGWVLTEVDHDYVLVGVPGYNKGKCLPVRRCSRTPFALSGEY